MVAALNPVNFDMRGFIQSICFLDSSNLEENRIPGLKQDSEHESEDDDSRNRRKKKRKKKKKKSS